MSTQALMSINEIIDQIKAVLEELRPTILQDGGDIHFVRFEDGTVFVKLHGACGSCPYSLMTLKNGVEQAIRRDVPEIKEVVAVDMA